jgi:hypothetical protein
VTAEEIFVKFSAEKAEQLHGRIKDCLARLTIAGRIFAL